MVVTVGIIPKLSLCIEENLKEALHDAHDLRHGIHYYGGKSFTLERLLKDVGHTWHINKGRLHTFLMRAIPVRLPCGL